MSIAQASFSFGCLDMRTFTYTSPTFITEALRLVTLASTAAFDDCFSELLPYTVLANYNSWWVCVYDAYQCHGHVINDNDYNCHVMAMELV